MESHFKIGTDKSSYNFPIKVLSFFQHILIKPFSVVHAASNIEQDRRSTEEHLSKGHGSHLEKKEKPKEFL